MNAQAIQRAIIRERYARNTTLPNYTPRNWFECDVFEVTAAGYFVEYEVKLSKSDFRADADKAKRHYDQDWNASLERKHDLLAVSDARGPSRFYFVTPENLIAEQELPPWAGLIIAHQGSRNVYLHTRRPAPQLHRIKLEDERFQSAMTTCYWRFLRLYLKT